MNASPNLLSTAIAEAMAAFPNVRRVAVAFSGGLDSGVLLHLMHGHALQHGLALHAFHIHHGLSAHADHWSAHCRAVCAGLQVPFAERRVVVATDGGNGIEEAAREARYAALGALCSEHAVELLLTAHHVNDQAETVLLQLLRGSGIAGLAAMEASNHAPGLLGTAAVTIARPLLAVRRAELEAYASDQGLASIEDESNADARYARNALRLNVMPVLEQHFPGFAERMARTARHAHAAQGLLDQMARHDFEQCSVGDALDLERVAALSIERADNLFRYWLGIRNWRMPSTSWLREMRTQLYGAKPEAQLCVSHPDGEIRRHRGRAYLVRKKEAAAAPQGFTWNGEARLHFPAYGGSLHFDVAGQGVAIDWLRGRACTLHYREGGERLKLAYNRPTRDLKHHYQSHDVPAWERETLPLASSGGALLFAAGLGMDSRCLAEPGQASVAISWRFDA